MNYLAHLILSGRNEDILFGNFIADYVKGTGLGHWPPWVKKGIQLHRKIDTFTDQHPLTAQGKLRLRLYCGKYAPVALDIIYDHFLAVHWQQFHHQTLAGYLDSTYPILNARKAEMPVRMQHMFMYMYRDNWLGNYFYPEGIQRALTGLSKRTKFESNLENAYDGMMKYYDDFTEEFLVFFPSLQKHVKEQMR